MLKKSCDPITVGQGECLFYDSYSITKAGAQNIQAKLKDSCTTYRILAAIHHCTTTQQIV